MYGFLDAGLTSDRKGGFCLRCGLGSSDKEWSGGCDSAVQARAGLGGQSYLGFRMLARALVEWEVTVRGVGWGKVSRKGGWVQVICEAGEDLTCLDADLTSNGKKAFTSSVTNYNFLNTYFSTSTNKE